METFFTKIKLLLLALNLLLASEVMPQVAISSVTVNEDLFIVYFEQANSMYTVTFKEGGEEKLKTITPNFTPTFLFSQLHKVHCLNIDNPKCTLNTTEEDALKTKASKLFIDLLYTYSNQQETLGQHIANLELNEEVPAHLIIQLAKSDTIKIEEDKISVFSPKGSNAYPVEKAKFSVDTLTRKLWWDKKYLKIQENFTPRKCQLVFEDGFITSVIVSGKFQDKKVAFSSQYPIGITTRTNVRRLNRIRLYDELGNFDSFVRLGEVINYERLTDVLTKDYSPKNGSVTLNEEARNKALHKDPVSKLFRANIFSDFAGINEETPNGLVQLELEKRINFNTNRSKLGKYGGGAFFTHLTPYFVWSKIEEHNRELPLTTFIDVTENTETNFVSPLESYRYSILKAGISINIFDAYWPAVDIQLNAVPGLTITQIAENTEDNNLTNNSNDERINSPLLGGELKLKFLPEKAFGFTISSRSFYYWNLNSNIRYNSIKGNLDEKELAVPQRMLHDLSLLLTVRSGAQNDNMFFARLGIIHEWSHLNNNFAQFQIGYSVYLKTSKKDNDG